MTCLDVLAPSTPFSTMAELQRSSGSRMSPLVPSGFGELFLQHLSEIAQKRKFRCIELPRAMIDQTQRADPAAVREGNGDPRVEPHMRLAGHQRIIREPRVLYRITDQKDGILQDRMGAKGHFPGCLRDVESLARLEPLAFAVDQAHERDRDIEQRRRDPGIAVEALLGRGVQDTKPVQRTQSCLLIIG